MFLKQNIKFLRQKNKYTQVEIANKLGITEVSYQKFEYLNYNDKPSLENIIKLKYIYNISIDDLLLKDLSKENVDPN